MDSQCPGCLGQAVVTLRLPCTIVESPQRHKRVPFVNIASLHSRSIKRRQWKHKMDYYDIVFAHLATGCGINAKDPSGLDLDWWIPRLRCCENQARAKALAGFQSHLSAVFTYLNPTPRGLSLYNIISKMMSILSQPLCINPRTLLSILLLWRIITCYINLLWWNCFEDKEKVHRSLLTFYRTQEHTKLNSLRPTHWGRVTHICVSKLTIICSDNGL